MRQLLSPMCVCVLGVMSLCLLRVLCVCTCECVVLCCVLDRMNNVNCCMYVDVSVKMPSCLNFVRHETRRDIGAEVVSRRTAKYFYCRRGIPPEYQTVTHDRSKVGVISS